MIRPSVLVVSDLPVLTGTWAEVQVRSRMDWYSLQKKVVRPFWLRRVKCVEGVTLCHMIFYSVTSLFDVTFSLFQKVT